jgi:hypothetical protein
MDETKAAVRKPADLATVASVGTSASRAGVMLSRMPCSVGSIPVRSDVCEGRVKGTCADARVARAPSCAIRSRLGVATSFEP